MATLSAEAIADHAFAAGFRGEALATAVAVALAESSGNTGARGDINLSTSGEVSVGLWQINYRPGRDAGNRTRDPVANLDPARNAQAAYTISSGGNSFGPWTMYTNGGYRRHLAAARAAAAGVSSRGGALTPLPSVAGPDPSTLGPVLGPPDPSVAGGGLVPNLLSTVSPDVGLPPPGQLLPAAYVEPLSIAHIVLESLAGAAEASSLHLAERVTTGGEVTMSVSQVSQLTLHVADPDRQLGRRGRLANGAPLYWSRPGAPVRDGSNLPWDGQVAAHEIDSEDPLTWVVTSRSAGAQQLRHGSVGAAATAKDVSLTEYAAGLARVVGLDITGQGLPRRPDIAPDETADRPESPWDVMQRVAEEEGVWVWEAGGRLYVGRPSWLIDRLVTVPVTVETGAVTDCVGLPRPRTSIDAPDGAATLDLRLPRWRGELVRPGMTVAMTWPEWLSNYPDRYLVESVRWPVDGGYDPVEVSCVEPIDPPLPEEAAVGDATVDGTVGTAPTTKPVDVSPEAASARPSARSAAGVIWPLAGKVTSFFGDDRPGRPGGHMGIDIAVPVGTPCRAVTDGVVSAINRADTAGLYLELRADNGLLSRYLHLDKAAVSVGARVSQGQVICYSGNTGINSSGPHLHFELRPGGAAVDPLTLLPKP